MFFAYIPLTFIESHTTCCSGATTPEGGIDCSAAVFVNGSSARRSANRIKNKKWPRNNTHDTQQQRYFYKKFGCRKKPCVAIVSHRINQSDVSEWM